MASGTDFMHDQSAKAERLNFLTMAIIVEGGLLATALVAGLVLGQFPWRHMILSVEAIELGIVATIPMLLLLVLMYQSRFKSLVQIRQVVEVTLGKSFASCGWFGLGVVALLAGLSEECLFRGVLEPWIGGWSPAAGLIASNLLFGLCHAITPAYFAYATLIGIYLSLTLKWTVEPNLVIPICCHALYDFVAFVVVKNSYLRKNLREPLSDGQSKTVADTSN